MFLLLILKYVHSWNTLPQCGTTPPKYTSTPWKQWSVDTPNKNIMGDCSQTISVTDMLKELVFEPLQSRRPQTRVTMMYRGVHILIVILHVPTNRTISGLSVRKTIILVLPEWAEVYRLTTNTTPTSWLEDQRSCQPITSIILQCQFLTRLLLLCRNQSVERNDNHYCGSWSL